MENTFPNYINPCQIVVRDFPHDFAKSEKRRFLKMFGAKRVVFAAKNQATATFNSAAEAQSILQFLHQRPLGNRLLSVHFGIRKNSEHLFKDNDHDDDDDDDKPSNVDVNDQVKCSEQLSTFVRRLNATNEKLNFSQPPPPHLKYLYPKLNQDIMDSIHIAMQSSTQFYTQVLHLMNRMNLEPPFAPGSRKLKFPTQMANNSTQTDRPERIAANLASDESELEDNDADTNGKRTELQSQSERLSIKRTKHLPPIITNPKRLRSAIDAKLTARKDNSESEPRRNVAEIFDIDPKRSMDFDRKINIQTPAALHTHAIDPTTSYSITSMNPIATNVGNIANDKSIESLDLIPLTDDELASNRIPFDQLSSNQLFQHYSAGTPSNKLYIKNLAKTVTESDLQQIYMRYSDGKISNIDIRLMKSGRMKGQAFVTFNNPYLSETNYDIVAKALRETNGFILKDKIMVVVYGKT